MQTLKKIITVIKRDGFRWFLTRIFGYLLGQEMEIRRTKIKALSILEEKYKNQVAYGLFKGMKLTSTYSWDPFSKINQILGTYEQHVQSELLNFKNKGAKCFIDIGAADGYFAVGHGVSRENFVWAVYGVSAGQPFVA